jgi:ferredoxin
VHPLRACIDVCPDDAISLQKVSLRTVTTATGSVSS